MICRGRAGSPLFTVIILSLLSLHSTSGMNASKERKVYFYFIDEVSGVKLNGCPPLQASFHSALRGCGLWIFSSRNSIFTLLSLHLFLNCLKREVNWLKWSERRIDGERLVFISITAAGHSVIWLMESINGGSSRESTKSIPSHFTKRKWNGINGLLLAGCSFIH